VKRALKITGVHSCARAARGTSTGAVSGRNPVSPEADVECAAPAITAQLALRNSRLSNAGLLNVQPARRSEIARYRYSKRPLGIVLDEVQEFIWIQELRQRLKEHADIGCAQQGPVVRDVLAPHRYAPFRVITRVISMQIYDPIPRGSRGGERWQGLVRVEYDLAVIGEVSRQADLTIQ